MLKTISVSQKKGFCVRVMGYWILFKPLAEHEGKPNNVGTAVCYYKLGTCTRCFLQVHVNYYNQKSDS